jgi:hypothetical protein
MTDGFPSANASILGLGVAVRIRTRAVFGAYIQRRLVEGQLETGLPALLRNLTPVGFLFLGLVSLASWQIFVSNMMGSFIAALLPKICRDVTVSGGATKHMILAALMMSSRSR